MKLFFPAALAAALSLALIAPTPASAETASGERQTLHGVQVKPTVKSRYGAKVTSRRIVSRKTKKPVAVTSRFSGTKLAKRTAAKAVRTASARKAARTASAKRAVAKATQPARVKRAVAKADKPTRVTKLAARTRKSASALKSAKWVGTASYYRHGRRTANGERFNPMGLTAAHRTLPFGTRLKVTHARTGRSVVVRINDRGPFIHGRIIDLAMGAARAIGVDGVAKVALQVL